jgi:hypothetical protein
MYRKGSGRWRTRAILRLASVRAALQLSGRMNTAEIVQPYTKRLLS